VSDTKLIEYPIADATIDQLASRYMPLTIGGVDDTAGFANVKKARIEIKGLRCDVENKRKALKKDALDWGRAVDAEAKRITAKLTPIESHLQQQEQAVVDEKERAKAAEREAAAKRLQARVDALQAVNCTIYSLAEIRDMTEGTYSDALAAATSAHETIVAAEAETQRVAAEEAERQRIDRENIEAAKAELVKAQAAVEAEKKRLADDAAAVERAAEMERQKKLAAERAVIEERERAEREAAEEKARLEIAEANAKARAEREESERLRLEAIRPDKDKLLAVASIVAGIDVPVMTGGQNSNDAAQAVSRVIDGAAAEITAIAEGM